MRNNHAAAHAAGTTREGWEMYAIQEFESWSDEDLTWHRDGYARVLRTGLTGRGQPLADWQRQTIAGDLEKINAEIQRRAAGSR